MLFSIPEASSLAVKFIWGPVSWVMGSRLNISHCMMAAWGKWNCPLGKWILKCQASKKFGIYEAWGYTGIILSFNPEICLSAQLQVHGFTSRIALNTISQILWIDFRYALLIFGRLTYDMLMTDDVKIHHMFPWQSIICIFVDFLIMNLYVIFIAFSYLTLDASLVPYWVCVCVCTSFPCQSHSEFNASIYIFDIHISTLICFSVAVFFVVLNKLLNKQSSCLWSEMLLCSCDTTVMLKKPWGRFAISYSV